MLTKRQFLVWKSCFFFPMDDFFWDAWESWNANLRNATYTTRQEFIPDLLLALIGFQWCWNEGFWLVFFLRSVCFYHAFDKTGVYSWSPCFLVCIMNDIPVKAQQLIVDSIKNQVCKFPQVVLCHSSGLLSSDVLFNAEYALMTSSRSICWTARSAWSQFFLV